MTRGSMLWGVVSLLVGGVLTLGHPPGVWAEVPTDPNSVGTAPPTQTEDQATNTHTVNVHKIDIDLKVKSIERAGLVYGMTGGWREEAARINKLLDASQSELDTIFSFQPFMLSGQILSPAIAQERNNFDLVDASTGVAFSRRYRMFDPARAVSIPPNWRTYLALDVPEAPMINKVLLPKTAKEKRVWAKAVSEGWTKGHVLADMNETIGLRTLKRDILGRVRYMRLLREGLVRPPLWATDDHGTKISLTDMTIGTTVTHIVHNARFQAPNHWKVFARTKKKSKPRYVRWHDETAPGHPLAGPPPPKVVPGEERDDFGAALEDQLTYAH